MIMKQLAPRNDIISIPHDPDELERGWPRNCLDIPPQHSSGPKNQATSRHSMRSYQREAQDSEVEFRSLNHRQSRYGALMAQCLDVDLNLKQWLTMPPPILIPPSLCSVV